MHGVETKYKGVGMASCRLRRDYRDEGREEYAIVCRLGIVIHAAEHQVGWYIEH
jgi:hypothetical protein